MKLIKKIISMLTICGIIFGGVNSNLAHAAIQPYSEVYRIYSADKVENSIYIAKSIYGESSPNAVVLATVNDYPDGLAGSQLAYKYNAPLLLVNKSINDSKNVMNYIEDNLPSGKTIYILGGTGVISDDYVTYFSEHYNVVRLYGMNRYETNQSVVNYLKVEKGTPMVLATGNGYADVISFSSIADINGYPIILNEKDNLLPNVINDIKNIEPTTIYIAGGTGVISSNIETQIKSINNNINIIRLGGLDRYETSIKIAQQFKFDSRIEYLAYGEDFTNALSGSVLAAKNNSHVILVNGNDTEKQTSLLENKGTIYLLGGNVCIDINYKLCNFPDGPCINDNCILDIS